MPREGAVCLQEGRREVRELVKSIFWQEPRSPPSFLALLALTHSWFTHTPNKGPLWGKSAGPAIVISISPSLFPYLENRDEKRSASGMRVFFQSENLKVVVPFLECCDIWTYVVPWYKSTFMEENVTTYHVFRIVICFFKPTCRT